MAIIGVEWCNSVVYSNGSVIVDQITAGTDQWKFIEFEGGHQSVGLYDIDHDS